MNEEKLLPFCECGCGERVEKLGNRFINHHYWKGKKHSQKSIDKISKNRKGILLGNHLSDDHKLAISKGKKGIPKSPNHCKAISESVKNSNACKSTIDKQRGGTDFVWHHVAYDFNNPEALRVRITRKFHGQIHSPKGLGVHQRGYSIID